MVATQIFFIFTPTWRKDSHFDSYFSSGLVQPPIRNLHDFWASTVSYTTLKTITCPSGSKEDGWVRFNSFPCQKKMKGPWNQGGPFKNHSFFRGKTGGFRFGFSFCIFPWHLPRLRLTRTLGQEFHAYGNSVASDIDALSSATSRCSGWCQG